VKKEELDICRNVSASLGADRTGKLTPSRDEARYVVVVEAVDAL
jgi:hypothetical protein